MSKKSVFFLVFLLISGFIHSQSMDLYVGAGASYGGYGVKGVIFATYLGLGTFEGEMTYEIGVRYPFSAKDYENNEAFTKPINSFYGAIQYGTIAVMTEYNYSTDEVDKESVSGWTLLVGYYYYVSNHIKLDAAVGYSFGKDVTFFKDTMFETKVSPNTVTYDLGIAYRIDF